MASGRERVSGKPGAVVTSDESVSDESVSDESVSDESLSVTRSTPSGWVTPPAVMSMRRSRTRGERVVPGVAFEAGVALEEPGRDPCPLGGTPEGLRVLRFGVEGHHQRIGAERGERRRSAPVVDIGGAGTPGAELSGRHGHVDTRIGRTLVVGVCDAGRRVTGRHGAVDREAGGVAHLVDEGVLDCLLAGGQHQLQLGTGMDVGAHRPGAALDGLDRWQAHGEREPVEVEVGGIEAAEAVPEDPEGEAAPGLGMEGAVEEGLPLHRLAVEGHRQRAVPCGGLRLHPGS